MRIKKREEIEEKEMFQAPSDLPRKSDKKEMVKHPDHYNDTPIETIEMFYLAFHDRPEMIKGALLFNIMKYRDRYRKKNGQEDLKKMEWYLDQLETHFERDVSTYSFYHDLKEFKKDGGSGQ